jgi:hypothetical protein
MILSKTDYEVDNLDPAREHCVNKGKPVACFYEYTENNS